MLQFLTMQLLESGLPQQENAVQLLDVLSLLPSPPSSCLPLSLPLYVPTCPQLAFSSLPFSFVISSPPHPSKYTYIIAVA